MADETPSTIDEWSAAGKFHDAHLASDARSWPNPFVVGKLSFTASRRAGTWLIRVPLLALAGTLAGLALGDMIAEPLAAARGEVDPGSYAQYSANPDARVAQGTPAAPCIGCPDSYGVAARMRGAREQRMESAFRELGAVNLDAPLPDEMTDDGYRYGGRFPDPEPETFAPEDTALPVIGGGARDVKTTSAPATEHRESEAR